MNQRAKILKTLIEAFDEFILSTGGNLDHRAAGNRDRKALLQFFKKVRGLPLYDTTELAEYIMKEGLTIHSLDGSPGITQADLSKNPCPSEWWVYDERGNCLGKERG